MTPAVSFKTLGCRLNQAETAAMAARFTAAGYRIVPFGHPCAVTIVHGCTITAKAERSSLYAARQARRIGRDGLVVLAGCPAETHGNTLHDNPAIDLVIGQTGKYTIPDLLHRLHPGRFPSPAAAGTSPLPVFDTQRALIKVQDGCDFQCAYCIVPAARGAPRSRPVGEVVTEAQQLVAAGFREIILTGANLGCFADAGLGLIDLIRSLEALPGLERIRLSSLEVSTAEQAIIDHMAGGSRLCRFLHLPLQSGDNGILAAMGRRYTRESYRETIEKATRAIPRLGLGTDIIVGFPGESDAAFDNTLALVRELPFSNLHIFPYSVRTGTHAASLPDPVPETIKKERLEVLAELGRAKLRLFAERFRGESASVLIERIDDDGLGYGWTSEYLAARVRGGNLTRREIVHARVEDVTSEGELACQAP